MVETETRRAYALDRRAAEPHAAAPPPPVPPRAAIARLGAAAGVVSGAAMIGWQMLAGEIAGEPTAVAGVDSSTWTAVTSITAFLFGSDAFSGSFALASIVFGLGFHLAIAAALGVVGVALLVWVQGARPGPVGALLQGVAYGLSLQIVALNLVVNNIEERNLVYESTPEWSWWLAHGAYGATLGLTAAALLRRRS